MGEEGMVCPVCRFVSVAYKAKAGEWERLECEEQFPGLPP